MTSFAKATRQFRNFMPTIYPGSNYFPRLEITRSFTFISSTHERDNFFLPIVLYTFYTFEIYYPRNARKKAFARSWNILLASRRWVDWKFLNVTIIDQLSKGSVSKFESFEISSLLDAIISFPLPLRLNNKFDGAKQSIFERFETKKFHSRENTGRDDPNDSREDEWIYLPKDPLSISSCGARISCSVRAAELCARSDIPSDCPISKQTGKKAIYIQPCSTVSRRSYVSLIKYLQE